MMSVWKRNAVVAAIVLFVCVAVYLNWSYGQTDATVMSDNQVTTGKTLGEAELVNSDTALSISDDDTDGASTTMAEDEDGWAQDALGNEELDQTEASGDSYFDIARLNREEARDSAMTMLQETVDDPDAAADAVSAAADSITAMAAAALQESEIESLVTAKGYQDCVAFIGDNSVSVVVAAADGADLQADDVARVTDIVCGETNFSASSVKVIQAE
jgi:stage III sporulation protein AH